MASKSTPSTAASTDWIPKDPAAVITKPGVMDFSDRPEVMAERRQAAKDLTRLLEKNTTFSFLRLGDGEIGYMMAVLAGRNSPRYRDYEDKGASVEQTFSISGMEARHYDRFMESLRECTFMDWCNYLPTHQAFLDKLPIHRDPLKLANRSPETSNIIFEFTHYELKHYLTQHRCLFAGAEAALMREMGKDPRYLALAAEHWPTGEQPFFHQVRNNGKNFSENLDLIKEDLRREIENNRCDTVFLSLASGAKIICYELAKEMNVRAVDFGSMTRALTYAGSPGYHSHRNFHNPFMFHVPFDVYMSALERAHPDMPLGQKIAKAHGQLVMDLQKLRPLMFNPSESVRGGAVDLSPDNLRNFRDNLRVYNEKYKPLALRDPQTRQLHRDFQRWLLKKGIGLQGKLFLVAVKAKGMLRSLRNAVLRRGNTTSAA